MSEYVIRFSVRQRIEHVSVMLLFITLSVTGLPQKFFDSWWATPIIFALGGIDQVRWIHRAAGITFTLLTVTHLTTAIGLVIVGRSPLSLVPTRQDFQDAIQTLRYYLGITDEPARFDRFDYRQKFEYWGLVLGAVVVINTLLDLIRDVIHYRYDVLVVHHLHRVEPMAGQDERQALQTLCRALKTAAVKHRLLVVVAGHLRREDSIFDRYHPPHLGSWLGSSAIEGESDLSLGLYRPLRKMTLAEERSIRSGEVSITDFVIPDTMAVKLLKHRYRGDVIDRVLLLHCKFGTISNYLPTPAPDARSAD